MYILNQIKTLFTLFIQQNFNELSSRGGSIDLNNNLPKSGLLDLKNELSLVEHEIDKFKTITNKKFLELPKEERLKYVLKPNINPDDVSNGNIKVLVFCFDLDGDGKINRDLYLKTTAGQVLPHEVQSVRIGETIYSRNGLKGEFFDKKNNRLVIHNKTKVVIEKLRTKEEIDRIEADNNKKIKEYGDTDNRIIIEEAIRRGIDPKFAVLAFSKIFNSIPGFTDGMELEDMFTQFDRERGYINGNADSKEVSLKLLIKYNPDNWEKLAKEYGINEDEIKEYKDEGMHYLSVEASSIQNADSLPNGERLRGDELLENPEFKKKLNEVAISIGANVEDLIKVMRAESGIDPRIVNKKSNAIGLIQFMPKTAIGLGTTVGKLRKMTGVEQLEYVEKYYLENRRGHNLDSVTKLYQATFYPVSLGKPDSYVMGGKLEAKQNQVIAQYSRRSDGLIDLNAFKKYVQNHTA